MFNALVIKNGASFKFLNHTITVITMNKHIQK